MHPLPSTSIVMSLARKHRRRGAVNRFLLVGLSAMAAVGIAIGYLTSPSIPSPSESTAANTRSGDATATPESASAVVASGMEHVADSIHRFPLSADDMTDQIEAPAIAVTASGLIALAWATEPQPDHRDVMFTTSSDGGQNFGEPRVVITTGVHTSVSEMRGRTIERRLRTLPLLAARDDTLFLAWVEAGSERDSVILRMAESADAGETFSAPVAVHQSRDARPTFTSLNVDGDGTVVCSWLDNRHNVQQPFAAIRQTGRTEFEPEVMVYGGPDGNGICPCCPTASCVSGDNVLVAFRGNESGFRDMWVATLLANATGFSEPEPIVGPTWEFAGCPHDGPSLCETSTGMHVAWMDAHEGTERVYVRTLGSKSPPVALGNPVSPEITQGHPQLIARHDELLLVWDQNHLANDSEQVPDEQEGKSVAQQPTAPRADHAHGTPPAAASGGRAIFLATSSDGGQTFSSPLAVAPVDDHFQTRPRIAVSPSDSIVVSWMELSESGKDVVVTTLPKDTTKNTSFVTVRGTSHE